MTDTVKSWIEERQAIRSYTTEDWQHYPHEDGGNFWAGGGRSDHHLTVDDAAFCVDAHRMFPHALGALDQVLELHEPIIYYEHEDSCTNTDEDHRTERHVEFDLGEYYCQDRPTGESDCEHCRDEDGDRLPYPCPTVQAIEGALND